MPLVDFYPAAAALDPTSMTLLQNTDATLYDIQDTAFITPVEVLDLQGLPLGSTIRASAQGFYPNFRAPGHIQLIAKAGNHQTPLISLYGLVLSVIPDPSEADDGLVVGVQGGQFALIPTVSEAPIELPDPENLPDGYVAIVTQGAWSAGPASPGSGTGSSGILIYTWNGSAYVDANGQVPPVAKPAGYWPIRIFETNGDPLAPFPTSPTWPGTSDKWLAPEV